MANSINAIIEAELKAAKTVEDAGEEARKIVADAAAAAAAKIDAAAETVKTNEQKLVADAVRRGEADAKKTLEDGRKESERIIEQNKNKKKAVDFIIGRVQNGNA